MQQRKGLHRGILKLTIAVALIFGAEHASHGAGLTESWYLARGRSNMRIKDYKAAMEAYEKVVATDPSNREAMRNLGTAYEAQGLTDKAIEQYDRYLERFPEDSEIAFKQAENLDWSRYAYRKQDAQKYYKMGLSKKDDTRMRLRYARLLSANKETNSEAIAQYERILAKNPHNGEAHRGLARAYAWRGESDRALYHHNLALRYGARSSDLSALKKDLSKGREPTVGARFQYLTQSGSSYALNGYSFGPRGQLDIGPFVTVTADAGYENYWNGPLTGSGAYFAASAQYRIDPSQRFVAGLGYHSMVLRSDSLLFHAHYEKDLESFSIRPGFRRNLKYDSFQSLIGTKSRAGMISGGAIANHFYSDFEMKSDRFDLVATPFAGWVSTASQPSNAQMGVEGRAELAIARAEGSGFELGAGYWLHVSHYGSDQSSSNAGGYFSPNVFVNQTPKLVLKWMQAGSYQLGAMGGPSIQYIDNPGPDDGLKIGADATVWYQRQFSAALAWNVSASYNRVSTVYNRFLAESGLTYMF